MNLTGIVKGLWNLFVWERKTLELCMNGKAFTHAMDNWYDRFQSGDSFGLTMQDFVRSGDFEVLDLLSHGPPTFEEMLGVREKFWLRINRKNLTAKLESEPETLEYRLSMYMKIGAAKPVFNLAGWIHSDLRLLEKAYSQKIIGEPEYAKLNERFSGLAGTAQAFLAAPHAESSGAHIYHVQPLESGFLYALMHHAWNVKNIYRLSDGSRQFDLEVFEKWDFGRSPSDSRITICLPLSALCANMCYECSLGHLAATDPKGVRALKADQIFELLYTNTIVNDDVTTHFFKPRGIKVYYLGGGDPGINIGEFEKAVAMVHDFYYNGTNAFVDWIWQNHREISGPREEFPFRQIASTIGMSMNSLDRLIELGRRYPEFGLQISLNAFNDETRKLFLRHPENLVGMREAAYAAERFYDATEVAGHARKAYLSVFLLKGVYDDVHQILHEFDTLIYDEAAGRYRPLDPEKVVITLDVVKYPPDNFGYSAASKRVFSRLKAELEKKGYEVIIYNPPLDRAVRDGCGVVSTELLQRRVALTPTS